MWERTQWQRQLVLTKRANQNEELGRVAETKATRFLFEFPPAECQAAQNAHSRGMNYLQLRANCQPTPWHCEHGALR
jgi:hypothetical protein